MDDGEATPISYMAVGQGTPVQTAGGLRFADRDTITEITDR